MYKESYPSQIWMWHTVLMPRELGQIVNTYPHYGDTLELIFTDGVTGEVTINGKRVELSGRTAVCIAPKQLHSVVYRSGGNFTRVLHINLEMIEKYINVKNIFSGEGRSLDDVPSRCREFDILYENALIIADSDAALDKKLLATLAIISTLLSSSERSSMIRSRESGAMRLVEWVESHYLQRITMRDAAEFFGYNKNYFSKWINNTTGTSFTDFLSSVRISHACAYLSNGHTIEDTAELCGFSDPSYFTKVFKKLRGTTPKSYALMARESEGY